MFGQPRSTFGAPTTAFGTGFGTPSTTASTTGFGGGTSFGRFGTPQQQTTSFGTSTTPFGAATSSATSLFGTQPQQSTGGLFGQPQTQASTGFTTGFGSTSGGGLFGQTQQPGAVAAGASNTTSICGAGLFGSTGIGSTGIGSTGITGFGAQQQSTQNRPFGFGQTTTSTTTTGGGLFGTTPSTGGCLLGTTTGFGATGGAAVSGTTVKYEPVTGSDTMTRNGVSTNIRTRIEVITAMKEYESKSMEELRVEDYLANRKGPGQAGTLGGFGQTQPQATPAAGGLFSTSGGTSLFGTKPLENKSMFGTTTSTSFGTTSGGSLFGAPAATPAFGQPATTNTGFSFGQTQQQQQPKATGFNFGSTATTTPSLFGGTTQQPQQPSFGMQGFQLGQNAQQPSTSGLFGTQNKPGTSGFLSTPSTGGGLFGNKPAGITQPLSTGFGATPTVTPFSNAANASTGGGLFGNQQQNKGTGLFSASNFNTGHSPFGSTGPFGQNNNQQKPANAMHFGTFCVPNIGTGFNSNPGGSFLNTSLPSNAMGIGGTGFGVTQQNLLGGGMTGTGLFPDLGKLVKAMTEKPMFDLAVDGKAAGKSGSPSSSDQVASKMSNSNLKPTYVLSPSLVSSTKPKPKPVNKPNNQNNNRHWLFKGLEDPNEESAEDFLKPKKYPSVRTLNLKVFRGSKADTSTPTTPLGTPGRINGEVDSGGKGGEEGGDCPSPLTTPLSTLGDATPLPLVASTNGQSRSNHSPTPDIIKGRGNIKHLNLTDKAGQHMDDTLADLNVRVARLKDPHHHHHHLDQDSEANKENDNSGNNISLFNASGDDDLPDVISPLSDEPHLTGIKLHRPGYYTLPPMEELAQMVVTEGDTKRCPVANFTVGRYGYGNVCFLGVTDVVGLDLDTVVFIVRKQVEVYPPGTTKPPRGQQLNRPAIVTLDCVWPVDKSTREVIKTCERLEAMGWTDYLERQCVKMEANFLEYRPETGSWVFKVKHFSKYGLQDDNEEDDMAAVPPKQQQPPPPESLMPLQTTTTTTSSILLPLALPHKNAGPPATALTSPPQFSLAHTTTTTTPALSQAQPPQTRFLESTLQDSYLPPEDYFMDSLAREPEESAALSIMSPSAERLTVVSRVVPRTVQLAKMQMFGGRDEDEEEEEQEQEDEVMAIGRQSHITTTRESTPTPQYPKAVNKRRMVSSDVSVSRMSSPSQDEARPRVGAQTTVRPPSPKTAGVHEEPRLHEPRTEYQLLPSGRDEGQEAGHAPPQHQAEEIPMAMSLMNGIQNCVADMGAFMGRSFRVGWGPGWTLAHVGPALALERNMATDGEMESVPAQSSPPPSFLFVGSMGSQSKVAKGVDGPRYKVLMEQVHTVQPDCGTISALVEECLACILEHSVLDGIEEMDDLSDPTPSSSTSPSCPSFRPLKDVELLHQLADTAALHSYQEPVLEEILTLCVALWGRLDFYSPETDGESEYSVSRARVEAVSQWLESVSQEAVVREVTGALAPEGGEEGYLEAILAHLTARQVSQACVLAQDRGDHHLALLLAQACMGQDSPRQIMADQLANWAEGGTDALMSPTRLTLYTLLAGTATHRATHMDLNTCTGLDWRRALALHLWYVCPATSTLAEALEEYDKAAGLDKNSSAYCNPPLPPYLATHALRNNMKVSHDMCYHLLKLFTDPRHPLETLLNPATATPDPLNVAISWLMWQVLESLSYHHLSSYHNASLHLSMAALLEAAGHWHWAVFVLLHLTDHDRRKLEVRELLLRHVKVGQEEDAGEVYSRQEVFVVERLQLPRKWIHEAKATRARTLGMVDEEAWYLLKAGDLNSAHTLIVETIAPNSIINEDHEYLLGYLDQIKAGEQHKQIAGWAAGGGVYSDYLEVNSLVSDMTTSQQPTPALLEQLRPRLLTLCSRLNNLQCRTALHRLCVSEMSKKVVGVLRAVVGEGIDATQVLSQQLSSLPLTHDYALAELNLITNHYLTHLAAES